MIMSERDARGPEDDEAARGPTLPHRPGPLRRQHRAADALAVLFVRSPHAHARIAGIDKTAALAMPGVVAIYTAEDTAADGLGHLPAISEIKDAEGNRHREPPHLPMPVGKVRHVGDIVAMVIAGTLDQARDAAEALVVDYEPLPAVVTVAQALAPGAPLLHDDVPGNLMCRWSKGDAAATDAAFARAAHVTTLSIRSPRQIVHYMETRAAWSAYEPADDVVTVTFASQGVQIPHRLMCERMLHVPPEKLRLVTAGCRRRLRPEVSDLSRAGPHRLGDAQARARPALGERTRPSLPCPTATRAISWRPASWRSMPTATSSRVRVKAESNYGAYVSMFAPTISTTGLAKVISGLYRIPAIRIDFDCAFTNTVPVDAIRGAGKPEALFLLETTGRSRRPRNRPQRGRPAAAQPARAGRHAVRRRQRLHLRCRRLHRPVRHGAAGRRRAGLRGAARGERGERQAARLRPVVPPARHRRHRRRACRSSRSSPTGWSPGSARKARDRATRRCSPSSCRQALGVPMDRIEVRQGDTRTIPHGGGTGGSSSTIISGTTLKRAADVVIQRGRDLAAERLETSPADIAFRDGVFEVVGTDRRIGLLELAALEAVRRRCRLRRQDRVVPDRRHGLRGRGRSRDRRDHARPADRRRRLRRRGQSTPARRPDAWRHRPRPRQCDDGRGRVRRGDRPAPDRHPDGLRPAARRRRALLHASRPSPRPRPTISWASRASASCRPTAHRRRSPMRCSTRWRRSACAISTCR